MRERDDNMRERDERDEREKWEKWEWDDKFFLTCNQTPKHISQTLSYSYLPF